MFLKKFTKEERSWIFYDWANSAYSTIITTVILPTFFLSIAISQGISDSAANTYWGYATSLGATAIALLAPVFGAVANYQGMKKRLFCVFFAFGVISTAALFFPMSWKMLLVLYAVTTVGFGGSGLFYDSFIIDVTTPERTHMVSSYGYGFGYIGGSTIPFIAAIVLVMFGENFGVSKDLAARISFVIAACWWLVFSIPFLRDVRQKYSIPRERGMIAKSLRNIIETFVNIKKYKAVFVFLLAYFFYIDGVNTVIHMATIYGASVGIDETQMIIALLVIQILAFPFALLFGRLSKKFGGAAMLKTGIVVYIGICVFAYFMTQSWQFWLIAVLVSTCQGGMQAISRSYFAGMLPKEKSNEFFGFYDIFGKFAAIMGPALYGFFTQIFGETRYGVLSIALLFVAGGAVFLFSERKKQDS